MEEEENFTGHKLRNAQWKIFSNSIFGERSPESGQLELLHKRVKIFVAIGIHFIFFKYGLCKRYNTEGFTEFIRSTGRGI